MTRPEEVRDIIFFLLLSIIDIVFNAAAGPAAVATGAHVNGSPLSQAALRLGVVAAVTKTGILTFVGFLRLANPNATAIVFLAIVTTVFGIAVIVTAQISNSVLGEVPTPLLIAALVAAIPLQGEGLSMLLNAKNRFPFYLGLMGSDALGGYVFARMAHNEGMDICSYKAAAAAGAVFGALSGIPKVIAAQTWPLVKGPQEAGT